MKPDPPQGLNAELSGVWVGWSRLGDREVAREAVAKGTYISLALTFLGLRKGISAAETEKWFKDEISLWTQELLTRKQVFKASHVLNNIGLDPKAKFSLIVSETTDKALRDYLLEHLQKTGHLDGSLAESWHLLKQLETSYIAIGSDKGTKQLTIKNIENQNRAWKQEVAVDLFFNNFDFSIQTLLTPGLAWPYLLKHNRVDLLTLWISVYFSQKPHVDAKISNMSPDLLARLRNLFLNWPIGDDALTRLSSDEVSQYTKETVRNALSTFGVFCENERTDLVAILRRFLNTCSVANAFKILQEPSSTVSLSGFYQLLAEFCAKHRLHLTLAMCSADYKFSDILVQKLNSKYLNMWLNVKGAFADLGDRGVFVEHILKVLQFLEKGVEDPQIFFFLVMLAKSVDLAKVIRERCAFTIGRKHFSSDDLLAMLEENAFRSAIFRRYVENQENCTISTFELLERHAGLDPRSVFPYKFTKDSGLPSFCSEDLIQAYGHVESIDYAYFLQQARPCKAYELAKQSQADPCRRYEMAQEALSLALKSFQTAEIAAGCVAFVEALGEDSARLRTLVHASRVLNSPQPVESGQLKALRRLERILVDEIKDANLLDAGELLGAIGRFQLALKFAKMHDLPLPIGFLEHCARHDLWLPFCVFAQVERYPVEQLGAAARRFSSHVLAEHLGHALLNDLQVANRSPFIKERDTRNSLYSRIGFQKTAEEMRLSHKSASSVGSATSAEMLADEAAGLHRELLHLLVRCHASGDPPKALLQASIYYGNPLFAVLANSYEPDSKLAHWLCWMSASCGINKDIVVTDTNHYDPNVVSSTIIAAVSKGFLRTLMDGLRIFLHDNPLCSFVQFLQSCVVDLSFDSGISDLDEFKSSLEQLKCNSVLADRDFDLTFLNNKYWLLDVAVKCICAAVSHCFTSQLNQIRFLSVLCEQKFCENLPVECPNFCKKLQLLECVRSSGVRLQLERIFDPAQRKDEIGNCVEQLINCDRFDLARTFCDLEDLNKDYILLSEWEKNYRSCKEPATFWANCDKCFRKNRIEAGTAVDFYLGKVETASSEPERYILLKLAVDWLRATNQEHSEFERRMWHSYFASSPSELPKRRSVAFSHLFEELDKEVSPCLVIPEDFDGKIVDTIGELLDAGDVLQAVRLEKLFGVGSKDLQVLKLIINLAEGNMKPQELNTEERLLLLSPETTLKPFSRLRRTLKTSRLSSASSGSFGSSTNINQLSDQIEVPIQDSIAVIETLTEKLQHGVKIAERVLITFRIAFNAGKTYREILKCVNASEQLRCILNDVNARNKLQIIDDFIILYAWDAEKVTTLLCDEIVGAVMVHNEAASDSVSLWNLNLDTSFHRVLQLCPENCSLLGSKFLSYIAYFQDNISVSHTSNEYFIMVEVLIRSHDCFTADCNMEGIATVLAKAANYVTDLVELKYWKAIVRLLTGLGRYTEMSYVFKLLKDSDQFEYLLKKQFRDDNSLKIALLEFLKRHCPDNRELFKIVSLHFKLFSEVADLWETEAKNIIENLIEISKLEMQNQGLGVDGMGVRFTSSDSTRQCLNKAMMNYTHATDHHIKGEKFAKAMTAAKNAELLALQISLVEETSPNGLVICILHLNWEQATRLVTNWLSLSRAMVVIEAYNLQVDWSNILFQQCVIPGNVGYLDQYCKLVGLTDNLIKDVCRRFITSNVATKASTDVMKVLLSRMKSVLVKYRLASELGFLDFVEEILKDSKLAYLKDTVWKKGYRS